MSDENLYPKEKKPLTKTENAVLLIALTIFCVILGFQSTKSSERPEYKNAYCMRYQIDEDNYGTIGSCSESLKDCKEWKKETRYLQGGYSFTPCEPYEFVWAYKNAMFGEVYWNAYPSEHLCNKELTNRLDNTGLGGPISSCRLIPAEDYFLRD